MYASSGCVSCASAQVLACGNKIEMAKFIPETLSATRPNRPVWFVRRFCSISSVGRPFSGLTADHIWAAGDIGIGEDAGK